MFYIRNRPSAVIGYAAEDLAAGDCVVIGNDGGFRKASHVPQQCGPISYAEAEDMVKVQSAQ